MADPDKLFPDHPALEVTRAMGRALFTGLPEVHSMETLKSPADPVRITAMTRPAAEMRAKTVELVTAGETAQSSTPL
jgi:hypothetical protein